MFSLRQSGSIRPVHRLVVLVAIKQEDWPCKTKTSLEWFLAIETNIKDVVSAILVLHISVLYPSKTRLHQ